MGEVISGWKKPPFKAEQEACRRKARWSKTLETEITVSPVMGGGGVGVEEGWEGQGRGERRLPGEAGQRGVHLHRELPSQVDFADTGDEQREKRGRKHLICIRGYLPPTFAGSNGPSQGKKNE